MIKNINITCMSYDIDLATKKYVIKKVGGLDRYLPRHATKSVFADVKLMDKSKKRNHDDEKFEAEVILKLPEKIINAKGLSSTMMMAIDAVEAKAQTQLRAYKQMSIDHIGRRGILSRFKRSFGRDL
jgi:putative sigma-54 modulation protein